MADLIGLAVSLLLVAAGLYGLAWLLISTRMFRRRAGTQRQGNAR